MSLHFPARAVALNVLAGLCLLAGTAAGHATVTPAYGGPGGSEFFLRCACGQYLVGFRARAGAWVDAIGLVCAPMDAATRKTSTNLIRTGWAGGKGGGAQEAYCPAGEKVTSIGIAHTRQSDGSPKFVNSIDIKCDGHEETTACISSGEGCKSGRHTDGLVYFLNVAYWYDKVRCPDGEYATGVHGRAGAFVDALGLICELPPAQPRAPATTSGRPVPPVHGLGKRPIGSGANDPSRVILSEPPAIPDAVRPQQGRVTTLPSACKPGFVSRVAGAKDLVCVTPESRARVRQENATAKQRVDPRGAHGPNSCKPGYVWREAFPGDVVCVTPQVRTMVREENRLDRSRRTR